MNKYKNLSYLCAICHKCVVVVLRSNWAANLKFAHLSFSRKVFGSITYCNHKQFWNSVDLKSTVSLSFAEY